MHPRAKSVPPLPPFPCATPSPCLHSPRRIHRLPRPRKPTANGPRTADYRHQGSTRKNNPPAKIASEGKIPKVEPVPSAYSPHLPPVLRFDSEGDADKLPRLLETARNAPLSEDDVRLLEQALRTHEPWLEWSGKAEEHRRGFFEVDPVALHIHERVSTQAILNCARRTDVARDLFAEPELSYREAVKFYRAPAQDRCLRPRRLRKRREPGSRGVTLRIAASEPSSRGLPLNFPRKPGQEQPAHVEPSRRMLNVDPDDPAPGVVVDRHAIGDLIRAGAHIVGEIDRQSVGVGEVGDLHGLKLRSGNAL